MYRSTVVCMLRDICSLPNRATPAYFFASKWTGGLTKKKHSIESFGHLFSASYNTQIWELSSSMDIALLYSYLFFCFNQCKKNHHPLSHTVYDNDANYRHSFTLRWLITLPVGSINRWFYSSWSVLHKIVSVH